MTLASSHGKKSLSPWPQFCSCPLKKLVFVPCTVSPMPTFNASPSSVFKAFCKHRTSIPMSNLSKQSSVFFFDNLTSIKINGIHHWWSRAAHRWACDTHPKSALMLKARWDLVSTRPHATIRSTVKIEGSWTTLFLRTWETRKRCATYFWVPLLNTFPLSELAGIQHKSIEVKAASVIALAFAALNSKGQDIHSSNSHKTTLFERRCVVICNCELIWI